MKYSKISKQDVYKIFVDNTVCISPHSGMPLSARYVAEHFKTSRYQSYKFIHQLVKDGFLEACCECVYSEDEYYLPYHGFILTAKGRETDYYKVSEKREWKEIENYINSVPS